MPRNGERVGQTDTFDMRVGQEIGAYKRGQQGQGGRRDEGGGVENLLKHTLLKIPQCSLLSCM